jgi:hypothetical protein
MRTPLDGQLVARLRAFAAEACAPGGVRAIFVVGSCATGTMNARSDVDVQVVHRYPWWQKRNVIVAGTEIDAVLAPLEYYHEALRAGHEAVADMLAAAVPVDDDENLTPALRAAAAGVLQRCAERAGRVTPFDELIRRRPVTLLRDAEDLLDDGDADGASFVVSYAVVNATQRFFARRYGRRPAMKQLYREIASREPHVHRLLQEFARAQGSVERITTAYAVIEALFEDAGGLAQLAGTERVSWRQALSFFA